MHHKKQTTRKRSNESKLQSACVKWFRLAYPEFSWLLFSIPNGGYRTPTEAKRLIGEGVVRGVPDLFLSVPNNRYHGFYLEMKFGKNKMTENQVTFSLHAKKNGYKHIVCYSFDTFRAEVEKYLNDRK